MNSVLSSTRPCNILLNRKTVIIFSLLVVDLKEKKKNRLASQVFNSDPGQVP